ncbi:M23 family metallopeptidase [Streptomyces griseus]|uniref:M23 family metallopeptidase n=1 Tax=Streptomyces stephensoniae TaxID=3375367 RepID=A0ABU2W0Y7_9ACTN|nr:M23 family metallopeptidase [Streptomyces griseus]MDT0491264.1 M23 family metallopeptidase [Streptomyces griseus]
MAVLVVALLTAALPPPRAAAGAGALPDALRAEGVPPPVPGADGDMGADEEPPPSAADGPDGGAGGDAGADTGAGPGAGSDTGSGSGTFAELDGGPVWPLAGRPAVLRGWEPPAGPYGPGHRGVDLAARPGDVVRAAATGRVSFAGRVAGRGVISVELAGSGAPPLRTTYEPVRALVRKGDLVVAGGPVGLLEAGPFHCAEGCLHWGLRRAKSYLDPLSLLPPHLLRRGPSRLLPVFGVPEPEVQEPGTPERGAPESGGTRAPGPGGTPEPGAALGTGAALGPEGAAMPGAAGLSPVRRAGSWRRRCPR